MNKKYIEILEEIATSIGGTITSPNDVIGRPDPFGYKKEKNGRQNKAMLGYKYQKLREGFNEMLALAEAIINEYSNMDAVKQVLDRKTEKLHTNSNKILDHKNAKSRLGFVQPTTVPDDTPKHNKEIADAKPEGEKLSKQALPLYNWVAKGYRKEKAYREKNGGKGEPKFNKEVTQKALDMINAAIRNKEVRDNS